MRYWWHVWRKHDVYRWRLGRDSFWHQSCLDCGYQWNHMRGRWPLDNDDRMRVAAALNCVELPPLWRYQRDG